MGQGQPTGRDVDLHYAGSVAEAAAGARVVALLTEWDQFRWLDFDRVRDVMRSAAIVDARNLLDPSAMRRRGFTYDGVGRR